MAQQTRVAVVTGVNRGIGLAILRQLASDSAGPLVVYASTRAGTLPEGVAEECQPHVKILPVRLSLRDPSSIDALASRVAKEQAAVDVLINNAGVYYYRERISDAERADTLETNYWGTLRMCQAFLPILRNPGGRIVNVSSQAGRLRWLAPHLRPRFLARDLTLDELDGLVREYDAAAARGGEVKAGWPPMAYSVSKAAVNAFTRILAREHPGLLINSCCPGWVKTDLGAQAGPPPKTPEEGARIPLHLAFGEIGETSGQYWANDSTGDSGIGKVQPAL
ncbi:cd6e152d-2084-4af4-8739-efc4f9c89202 [Thermothielavioides terrestris]|uniref:Cd6e152d-2084-4af4-8739-efc4f9c89202 n=1 Tax=Thermothielavioides terrestris TaxID=2587410 RepID=A0A446BXX3_9PEZI|nr:cd6e152d-2084-4af4-8739-efc4f9c89202 [Thermothielavioides terrestris]